MSVSENLNTVSESQYKNKLPNLNQQQQASHLKQNDIFMR